MIKKKSYEIINSCLEWLKEVIDKSDNIIDAKEILEDKRLGILKKECYKNILLDDQYYLLGKLTCDTLNLYVLEDNSKHQPNNLWIDFIRIEELDGEHYLLGNIVGLGNKIVLDDVYVSPMTLNSEESTIKIYRKKADKKYSLKLKSGLKILRAVLSMR